MTSTVTPSRLRFIATTHKLQILAVIFLLASMALHSYSTYSRGVLPDFLTTELLKSISNAAMVALMLVTLALSWNVFGILGFIISVIVTWIPGVNILLWFVANMRGSSILRKAGVKVGLFGADSSTLPPVN